MEHLCMEMVMCICCMLLCTACFEPRPAQKGSGICEERCLHVLQTLSTESALVSCF